MFAGGNGKYTELDQLVLNYIGKESAVLKGLPVAESEVAPSEQPSSFLKMLMNKGEVNETSRNLKQ